MLPLLESSKYSVNPPWIYFRDGLSTRMRYRLSGAHLVLDSEGIFIDNARWGAAFPQYVWRCERQR